MSNRIFGNSGGATPGIAVMGLALSIGWATFVNARATTLDAPQSATAGSDAHTEITYPQIYATRDGETHFRKVTVSLTKAALAPPASPAFFGPHQTGTNMQWVVFPKPYGLQELKEGILHNPSALRFVSVREGSLGIKTSDGEIRHFQKGDIVEAIDGKPSKGHITFSEEGAVVLFSDH